MVVVMIVKLRLFPHFNLIYEIVLCAIRVIILGLIELHFLILSYLPFSGTAAQVG